MTPEEMQMEHPETPDVPLIDTAQEERVQAAARQRALAAQQSVGSLYGEPAETEPAGEAFLRAFRAAL